ASLFRFLDHGGPYGQMAGKTATVAIGADHGGYELKETLKQHLQKRGVSIADLGTNSKESTDYPDYAQAVAHKVSIRPAEFGLLICTTGVGMSITANKVPGIRAALVGDEETAALARKHNDANVLCLAGKMTGAEEARKIVDAFLNAHFEGGRHERRVHKME